MKFKKIVCMIVLFFFSFSIFPGTILAYPNFKTKIKDRPDTYNLAPANYPNIFLSPFFYQRYFNHIDPDDGYLHVFAQDYYLNGVDELPVIIDKVYNSSFKRKGLFGKGWHFIYEIRIDKIDAKSIHFTNPYGKKQIFQAVNEKEYVCWEGGKTQIRKTAEGYVKWSNNKIKYHFDQTGRLVSVESKNGNTLKFKYQDDSLFEIVDTLNRKIRLTTNANGCIKKILTPTGEILTYHYNPDDLLLKVENSKGSSLHYEYDTKGRLVKINYPENRKTSFKYVDDSRRPSEQYAPEGYHASYQYRKTEDGLIEFTIKEAPDKITKYQHDTSKGQLVVTNALNQQWSIELNKKLKLPEKVTKPGGGVTRYQYNQDGLLAVVENAIGNKITLHYSSANDLETMRMPSGSAWRFDYDQKGNVVSIINPDKIEYKLAYNSNGTIASFINGKGQAYTFKYDEWARPESIVGPMKLLRTFKYDDIGRVIEESIANKKLYRIDYHDDEKRARLSIAGTHVEFNYDGAGLLTEIKDSFSRSTRYQYNGHGLISRITDPAQSQFEYKYNSFGKLTSLKLPNGEEHRYEYDALNRLKRIIDPEGRKENYSYEADGNLSRILKANQGEIGFQYDQLGRVTKLLENLKNVGAYEYDKENYLTKVAYKGTDNAYQFNGSGLLVESENLKTNRKFKYQYDKNGNVISVRYPNGEKIDYSYDEIDRLTSVTFPKGEQIKYTYAKNKKSINYPNGTTAEFVFDDEGLLNAYKVLNRSGQPILKHKYDYDAKGNLTRLNQDESKSADFSYDTLDQLTSIETDDGYRSYQYNRYGDRIAQDGIGGHIETDYDLDGRLLKYGNITFRYDFSGNLIQKKSEKQHLEFNFSLFSELTSCDVDGKKTEFAYNGFGQRVTKNTPDSEIRYEYIFDNVGVEKDSQSKTTKQFFYGPNPDEILAVSIGAKRYYYHLDRFNHVVLITNDQGKVVNQYEYNAFGEIKEKQEKIDNPYTYTARRSDPETNLLYYRSRYYDPEIGRFISQDSFPAFYAVPQSFNRYTYVLNNPNRYRDPDGKWVHILVGAAIGAVVNTAIKAGSNYINDRPLTEGLVGAAASGAVTGAIGAATGGATLLAKPAINAASSAVGKVVENGVNNLVEGRPLTDNIFEGITAESVAFDAVFGTVADAAGDYVGKKVGRQLGKKFTKFIGYSPAGRIPNWVKGGSHPFKSFLRFGRNTQRELIQKFFEKAVGKVTEKALEKAFDEVINKADLDEEDESISVDASLNVDVNTSNGFGVNASIGVDSSVSVGKKDQDKQASSKNDANSAGTALKPDGEKSNNSETDQSPGVMVGRPKEPARVNTKRPKYPDKVNTERPPEPPPVKTPPVPKPAPFPWR